MTKPPSSAHPFVPAEFNNSDQTVARISNSQRDSFELLIRNLLIANGSDFTVTSEKIMSEMKKKELTPQDWHSVGIFLLNSGHSHLLVKEIIQNNILQKKYDFHWGYFAEGLSKVCSQTGIDLQKAIVSAAEEKDKLELLCISHSLDNADARMRSIRLKRKRQQLNRFAQIRADLLSQLETVRSQELESEEEALLKRLLQMYPKDPEIRLLDQNYRAKKALKLLESKRHQATSTTVYEEIDWSPDQSLKTESDKIFSACVEIWKKLGEPPWLGRDFALTWFWFEDPIRSIEFLPEVSNHTYWEQFDESDYNTNLRLSMIWLRLEMLILGRRFLDCLSELAQFESEVTQNPEMIMGVLYFRAQANWGLKNKIDAIEILESIVSSNPTFRSASTLLHLWKNQR